LEREAGRPISSIDLETLTREAVANAFDKPVLEIGELTVREQAYAQEFRDQYDNDAWLFGKSEENRFRHLVVRGDTVGYGREKAVGGMLWATLVVRKGQIIHAILNGDWHPRPIDSVGWLEDTLIGAKATKEALSARVSSFMARKDVEFAGVETHNLMAALAKALANLGSVD